MTPVLAARAISKQYPGTLALDRVDFTVRRAHVNVLIGENGAGKSTLVKILAGVEPPGSGTLELDGAPVRFAGTRDAAARGIAMIHQELNLLPNLSVADNIFVGREQTRFGVVDRRAQERTSRALLERLEQPIDPRTLVGDLPLGRQQIVEIAKALARDVRVLIMDEPTSALSVSEIEVLFRLIRDLKSRGVSLVYISHRLEELLRIGDCVTILRDGRAVAEAPVAGLTVPWIVEQMTGGTGPWPVQTNLAPTKPLLEVESPRLTVRAGEIVGLYGLMGAGRTELLESLIGLRRAAGAVILDGRRVDQLDLPRRIAAGMALVPEDRQRAGIVPTLSVKDNITLARLRGFYLSPARERAQAETFIRDLRIRTAGAGRPIVSLSGGNQQKVVISRFLFTEPKLLLLDEPTRGVDVGARAEIFEIIRGLAARGMAVLFASSELQEVLALAARILAMAAGRITAEFTAGAASEEALVAAASPGGVHAHA